MTANKDKDKNKEQDPKNQQAAPPVCIREKFGRLNPELKDLVRESDFQESEHKYYIQPPSIAVGMYLVLFAGLFLAGGLLAAYSLFVRKSMDMYAIKLVIMIVFPLVSLFSGAVGFKMDIKRLGRKKYYLFMRPEGLIERSYRHVTFIPQNKIHFAFERKELRVSKSDLYYDSIVYSDASGRKWLYDLKDHYYSKESDAAKGRRENVGHDNLYEKIQQFYKVSSPPPNKNFPHQF